MIHIDSIRNSCAHIAAGLTVALFAAVPTFADDTEVLLGARLDPGEPNVIFLVDTSGSMNSDVVVGTDYDPERTYVGDCSAERYYWSRQSSGAVSIPGCAERLATYIESRAMRCKIGLDAMTSEGFYRDRFAQWDTDRSPSSWQVVAFASAGDTVPGAERPTECSGDSGIHGETPGPYYIANGRYGPWTTDPARAEDWATTGDIYTFYHGNFLNYIQEAGEESTINSRMEIVRRVAREVLTPLDGLNAAMMRFSTNSQGGMVLHEMVPIDSGRPSLLTSIDGFAASGGTPLAETLFEAGQYYGGRAVVYGRDSIGSSGELLPSVAASRDGDTYVSPITRQCQRSNIVLLTDGFPASDTDADSRITGLPGFSGGCSGSCLDEMATYLNTVDQRPGPALPGAQTVQTFTIGFHTDQPLLAATATGTVPVRDDAGVIVLDDAGEPVTRPGYFTVTDEAGLAQAFEDILASIQSAGESFTSPALAIDVQNRLTNREDIFLAMFQPSLRGEPHWDGNLKKYRIGRAAASDATPRIIDANGNAVVGDDGLINDSAQSFWSLEADGGDVTEGGFIHTLTTSRRVVSNIVSDDLTAAGNQVTPGNTDLTAELLVVDPSLREAVIDWMRGLNADGTARNAIGDPLHSEPAILAYSGDRFALFFGTNDGFLHAIDPEPVGRGVTDLEHFAFVPRELLPLMDTMRRNEPRASRTKEYGLDGPLRLWIRRDNGNQVVESGERALLFVGMRRGGRSYYALDVTDVDAPSLVWKIEGGSGDFAELGQTWSAPVIGKVRLDDVDREVLFIGGGYDTNQDARDRPATDDDMGRAVYILDALTGERLWWASIRSDADLTLEDMTHSIPSDLRVIDTDGDGYDDRIYVGDTKAQMWRFDINNREGVITGGLFASVGGSGEANNRRIYYPPSVTRVTDELLGNFLTVSFGTGHRAHPLEADVADGFFMIRDPHPFLPPVNPATGLVDYPEPVQPRELLDVTADATPTTESLSRRDGWFIRFDSSEKNLSAPLAVLDRIFFTTYLPTRPELGCTPTPIIGSGRLYAINILTGTPVNYADTPTPPERYIDLDQGGLPPAPRLVFTEPVCEDCDPSEVPVSEITMLVGTEAFDPGILNVPHRTYWVQEDIDR